MANLGRQFYSPNAHIFNKTELEASEKAYFLAVNNKWNCVKDIMEVTGYDALKYYYNHLVLPTRDKVEQELKKFGILDKIVNSNMNNLQKTLAKNEIIEKCMKYSIPAIQYVGKSRLVKEAKYVQASDFLDLVEDRYISSLDRRIPEGTRWFKYPRFLKQSMECDAHKSQYKGNNTSCIHIRFVRDSGYETDPLSRKMSDFESKAFGKERYDSDRNAWILKLEETHRAIRDGREDIAFDNVIEFRDIVYSKQLDLMAEDMATDFFEEPYE